MTAKRAVQHTSAADRKHVARSNNTTSRLPHDAASHKIHKSTSKNKQSATITGRWNDRRLATLSSQAHQNLSTMRARSRAPSASSQRGTTARRAGSEKARIGWNSLPAELRNTVYHNALVISGTENSHSQFDGTIDLQCGLLRLDRRARHETRSILAGATKFTICGDRWREQMQGVKLDTSKDIAVTWSTGPWDELKALATHLADAAQLECLKLHFPLKLTKERGTRQGTAEVAAALAPWARVVHKRLEISGSERRITRMTRSPWGGLWTVQYSLSAVNLVQFVVDDRGFDVYEGRKWCRTIQRALRKAFPFDGGERFPLDCNDNLSPIGGWPVY